MMTESSLSNRLLLGRFLTRSGDQAWDFAVPIVLLHLMPGQLRIAALYFLILRIATVLLLPRLSMLIDRIDRQSTAKIGMVLQLVGVLAGFFSVLYLPVEGHDHFSSLLFIAMFLMLSMSGVVAQLGSSFMDIAIANDLVPSAIAPDHLAGFNSRLRQVDLATEVASPIAAGILLLLTTAEYPLLGFGFIALWNVVSFLPEYGILASIFKLNPHLRKKPVVLSPGTTSIFARLRNGWLTFFREPVAPVMIAYALLWLSVLSPHGVLLTAYLKDGWNTPEWMIGIFRGMGAVFGLAATILFPVLLKRMSVERTSLIFLSLQTVAVVVSLGFFLIAGPIGEIGFLICILLSRIGLYGFSLGEMQIRQVEIAPHSRGQVNGFASALTALATIGLYGAGVALPSTEDFRLLVIFSVTFVALALAVYAFWFRLIKRS